MFGRSALKVAYGIEVADENDVHIATVERALGGVAEGFTPGAFLVDLIPILKYVPAWMPGAGWKKKAARWKVDAIATKEMTWQDLNVRCPVATIHRPRHLIRTYCLPVERSRLSYCRPTVTAHRSLRGRSIS